MSPSVVYVMCRSESMTHRDIIAVNPFMNFQKRVELNILRGNPELVPAQNHRRRRQQQEWRRIRFLSLSLGGILKVKRSL